MAFDRNDAAHLATLKTELTTDPVAMGYDILGSMTAVSVLINDAAANTAPADGVPTLTTGAVWDILVDEPIASGSQFVVQLLFEATQGLGDDISDKRAGLTTIDIGLGNKISALTRPLSRSEVLFSGLDANGTNEVVNLSVQDLVAALAS